ncbi:MAG: DHH family phosphoesterase [Methanomicrobiales archaeon]|jgi:RecJ-like exonuclease|nr:DHH family phosphoesterase [Methanomicrobiales archaeon]
MRQTCPDADLAAASEVIQASDAVTIISHIDADGITSESILSQAISRLEIPVKTAFIRQLDPLTLHQIPQDDSLKIFSDLGSGQQVLIEQLGFASDQVVIVDHHVSQPSESEYLEVNSLKYGEHKTSAAGIAYLISKELDSANTDLAKLGIIGNVGDMMDREDLCFTGLAKTILEDAINYGNVEIWKKDLNIYGISTRPLPNALAYTDDIDIPGISNDISGAQRFLERLGVVSPHGKAWPVWQDLSFEQKQSITSALVEHVIAHNRSAERMFIDHYLFLDERREYGPLLNASEYATLLNSCGRWSKPALGSAICRGDRGTSYLEADIMLRNHRAKIREVLEYITDKGVSEYSHMLFIHVGSLFPDTIVGIGSGIALSRLNPKKPILIMCEDSMDETVTKVSMRTKPDVIKSGVDLQAALSMVAEKYGGSGGGHKIAAGAFIPKEVEQEFVEDVNRVLAEQFGTSENNS